MAERRLEHMGSGLDRRVEFLSKILGLDETQQVTVTEAFSSAKSSLRVLLEGIRDGEVLFEDGLYETIMIRETTRDAVTAILNEEQQETFSVLRSFGHRRGGHLLYL